MVEKTYLTQQRQQQLEKEPYLKVLEQWGNYCYVPLDIPRIEYPEVVEWFFDRCKPTSKVRSDIAGDTYGDTENLFDTVDVSFTDKEYAFQIWKLNLQNDFIDLFPQVYEKIMDEFPFKSIENFRFWSSRSGIRFHRDQTRFVDYPGAFRINLEDTNFISTLRLVESVPGSDIANSPKFTLPRLEDTNSFVWNNLRTEHGSLHNKKFHKILLIIDNYELDINRYNLLIERSISKYSDHLMVSKKTLEEFVGTV